MSFIKIVIGLLTVGILSLSVSGCVILDKAYHEKIDALTTNRELFVNKTKEVLAKVSAGELEWDVGIALAGEYSAEAAKIYAEIKDIESVHGFKWYEILGGAVANFAILALFGQAGLKWKKVAVDLVSSIHDARLSKGDAEDVVFLASEKHNSALNKLAEKLPSHKA